ncbi:MAG: hypothetical protein Q9208_001105 [Pyrenodesmia sp. 3 TL-2023]
MEAVAAAGFAVQVADVGGRALLGMLGLLKDLRETPKQMTELLEDTSRSVHRICSLRDALQQPIELSTHLSTKQMQDIIESIDNAYEAIIDLQQELEPLFRKVHAPKDGLVKRAWISLVLVQMEKSIKWRLARIERLDREVASAMQLAGLKTGAESMKLSSRILKSVEADSINTASCLSYLTKTSREIQRATQVSESQVIQLHSDVTQIKRVVGDVETLLTYLTTHLGEADKPTQPLRAAATACSSGPPSSSSSYIGLAMQASKRLTKSPSVVKKVCGQVDLPPHSSMKGLVQQRELVKPGCDCGFVRRRRTYQQGPLSVTWDFCTKHSPPCQNRKLHLQSWSWSFSALMLPVLQLAIQQTIAATTGAGGYSIGMSMKYFGVVKRCESPAYQLLDRFPDSCAYKSYELGSLSRNLYDSEVIKSQHTHFDRRSKYWFSFVWNLELVKSELKRLRKDLSLLFATGQASASCSDEYGNTLLHALFLLIGNLGSNAEFVADELRLLAELIIDAGVDVNAASRRMDFEYSIRYIR